MFNRSVHEENKQFVKELLTIGQGSLEIGVVSYWPLAETSVTENPDEYKIKIIDKDFLTSVGDFPQTETDELSKWDLVLLMQDMEKAINEHMIFMLKNRLIPREKILNWFPKNNIIKSLGKWWYCLVKMPNILNYYEMLCSGEVIELDSEGIEERLPLKPMRTVSLYDNMKVFDNEMVEIFGCTLYGIEKDVLLYSTGKMSVAEIIEAIHTKVSDKDIIENIVVKTLLNLEKNFIIVYSKY